MADDTKSPSKRRPAIPKGTRKLNRPRLLISGLTVEQEAYCRARALGMSIQEAIAAGGLNVSVSTARNWETNKGTGHNHAIRARIDELAAIAQNNAILKSGLDREWVISRLMSVTERCMQAEEVLDHEGNKTGEYKFDSRGAVAALKLLGDTLGLFKPVENKPGDEYENLSDEDIARIAQELAAQTGLLEACAGTEAATGTQQAIEVQTVPKAG